MVVMAGPPSVLTHSYHTAAADGPAIAADRPDDRLAELPPLGPRLTIGRGHFARIPPWRPPAAPGKLQGGGARLATDWWAPLGPGVMAWHPPGGASSAPSWRWAGWRPRPPDCRPN